jgi:hypothetical protein
MPMSDEAHLPAAKPQRARKPAKKAAKPASTPRPRTRAKDAATGETVASPRAPVSTVPEITKAPAAPSRRASAVRLGILTTTLASLIGGLALFEEMPDLSQSGPLKIAFSSYKAAEQAPQDPLTPYMRHSIDQELRLAAMALEMREGNESLSRLREDTRALAASVRSLSNGVELLTDDVDGARTDAIVRLARLENRLQGIEVAGLARLEDRLQEIEAAAAPQPIPLGDPALSELTRLGHPGYAHREPIVAQAEQPVTTGAVPEIAARPQATVTVSFAKPKPRLKAAKPIGGWLVHNVRDDLALVEGDGAHYEVRAGEELPGAGIVRSIKKRGEKWVILTNKGVITEPK